MEPPAKPPAKRRATSMQSSNITQPQYISDTSPSPFASKKPLRGGSEPRHPHSRSQLVSIGWEEGDDTLSRRTSRLQMELAECVETKIVTTTTTTKRSYPPLLIQQHSLEKLDAKEYPLALKPTPPELATFSYEIDGRLVDLYEGASQTQDTEDSRFDSVSRSYTPSDPKTEQYFLDEVAHKPVEKKELQHALTLVSQRRSTGGKLRKSQRLTDIQSKDAPDVRERPRHRGLGMHLSSDYTPFPATPDTSELVSSNTGRSRPFASSFFENTYTPQSGLSQDESFEGVPSPSERQEAFANAVATPPIAESDLEPFENSDVGNSFGQYETANVSHGSGQRPNLDTAAAQNASLPSPGLSPTMATAELESGFPEDTEDDTQSGDSQETLADDQVPGKSSLDVQQRLGQSPLAPVRAPSSVMDTRSMLETFDAMPNDMKTFMMYQFLRRCSRKTLHVISDVVNPALKCDFLDQLPTELSLHILSFLDHKDLCRAAQVSKQWRNIIDSNETGWKELLDRDGFVLPVGELERAVKQGWGWQDPYGPDGFEQDMSVQHSEADITVLGGHEVENEPTRKVRTTTKRKRASAGLGSERAKRRAVNHEFSDKAQGILSKYPQTARFHKSEGPLTAASQAALAVPDPELGLPSLRKLHLFKSLYRRRYMLKNSWMSGRVAPHHFAFPAHPAHVITCLQFDDDKILTGSDDTLIHVYDTKTGVLRKKLEGHEGGVWALQYEGNVLVSGSTDRSVRVWDIEKGLCTQVFHGHTSTVRCLQILMPEMTGKTDKGNPIMVPEKPLIITGSRDSQLRVWRLPEQGSKRYIQTGPPANDADCPYFVRLLTGHTHSVRAIAAHQDTLVSGSYDNTVRVWRISTGETVHRLQGHSMKVYSVVLDYKRNRCISGSMDNYVKIWSLETGACLFTLEGHSSLVGLLDLRDERLVSAAADSTLRIWDPENGQCKSTLSAHTGAITCFQHDGQKVISGSDRTLKMWNVKTGECMKDLLTDLSGVWQVKFDERRCVAAVQRDNLTFVEVLDFGASRDGIPSSQRGTRKLLRFDVDEARAVVEEDEDA